MGQKGSSRTNGGKSKPSGFKKTGDGKWPTVTVEPGQFRKQMLKNIQQLSRDSMGTYHGKKDVKTVKPDRGQTSMDNLRSWASGKVRSGDNPFKGKS